MSKRKQTDLLSNFGFTKKCKPIYSEPEEQPEQDKPTEKDRDGGNSSTEEEAGGDDDANPPCPSLPANWTSQQYREWKNRNKWLFVKGGSLGCTVCRDAKLLLLSEKVIGTHLSKEWINGDVSSNAQNQLRKKIYKHRDSIAHKRAVEIAANKQRDILPNKVLEITSKLTEETATSFRSAYMVAKERLAYKKLPPLIKLQELNGAKVGTVHTVSQITPVLKL